MKIDLTIAEIEVLKFLLISGIDIAEEMAKEGRVTTSLTGSYFSDVKLMRETLRKLEGAK